MIFGSDNMTGASEILMDALRQANSGAARSYGDDPWTREAEGLLKETFQHELAAFFVATGTAANSLALSALVEPWNAVLCHSEAHILVDENSAPEFFTGGARLIPVRGTGSKVTAEALRETLEHIPSDRPHNVRPGAVSISQVSECGHVYQPHEIAAVSEVARSHRLAMHMDGARFANAVAALGCHPADITWRAGVDVLCLGASKNGALAAEAVIFFDRERAADFAERRKRGGHLLSKGRFLGAQFAAWLKNGHWLELARTANQRASELSAGMAGIPGVRLAWPTEANEIFAILPRSLDRQLRAGGASYYEWNRDSTPPGMPLADGEILARLVTSFATLTNDVEAFLALAQDRAAPSSAN